MLTTRFTQAFGLRHPIALAPMDPASGGRLAAAVSNAGALGMVGGGYGCHATLQRELALAGEAPVGCGFITWSMARDPSLLDRALEHRPRCLMLSFADPAPFAARVHAAGVPLLCQVQTLEHVQRALDVGAAAVVAQGTEAGGHGFDHQTTMTFVPEVADHLAAHSPQTLLLAAGGIADGRGLAAALMLGADGVLMGTRFWATQEALIHPAAKASVLPARGAHTLRTSVYDIVRGRDWPAPYTGRLMRNGFIERWHGHEQDLRGLRESELRAVELAYQAGDPAYGNVTVGQAIGLIGDIPTAGEVVARTVRQAHALIARRPGV